MPTPAQSIETFCAMWAQPGGFADSIHRFFTDETVYENVGLSHTVGIEQALGLVQTFEKDLGLVTIGVDMLGIVANGDIVMTERVDHMIDASGATTKSIRLMGIFEMRGDKIVGWRDYFDASDFKGG